MISNIRMPKNPYPGFNTKILGRVANKVMKVSHDTHTNGPVEFETIETVGFTGDELEKTAVANAAAAVAKQPMGFWSGVGQRALSTIVAAGVLGAGMYGVGKGMEYMQGIADKSRYDASLKAAIQMSPTLQRHGYERIKGYMPMIIKASPTVASEPRLLANYLESLIDAEGHLNMATFGELASIEGNILRNQDMRNGVSKTIAQTATKGALEGVTRGLTEGTINMFSLDD